MIYAYTAINTDPEIPSAAKASRLELFKEKADRDNAAYASYSADFDEYSYLIDKDFTPRKLTKNEFVKAFDEDKAVCIQLEEHHINYEPFCKNIP